jgi:hypothetical protein
MSPVVHSVSFTFFLIMLYSLYLKNGFLLYHSKVMDVFIKAAEYMEMPVRRSDDEPLQKLFIAVRSELNLDLKNIKTEQAKFWKQHPSLVKVGLWLLHILAQNDLCRI